MKQKKRIGWFVQGVKEWIISYLVILIIPIMICSVFFLYTYFVIWEETRESNSTALQLIAMELDEMFEQSFLLEYNIQNSTNVKMAAEIRQPLDADKRYLLRKASLDVQGYTGGDQRIGSWYVCFPKSEMALCVGGYYISQEEVYKRFGEACGYTVEEWDVLLEQRNDRKFLAGQDNGMIGYISSLPMRGEAVKMNVILEFNYEYIQNTLSYLDYMKNSGIVLADADNRVLVSRNLEDIDIKMLSRQLETGAGYQTIMINGEKMMASCIQAERVGLKMVSIIPYREFWKTALESLTSFLVALFLCVLLGTGLAYFFSVGKQRTWGKFKRIVNLKLDGKAENQRFRNKEIAAAIDNVVMEYDNMQKQLSSVDSMKKDLLVSAALRGRIRAEEVEQVFEKNGVSYEIGNYVVMSFHLSHFDHIFDVEKKESSSKDIGLSREAVISVVQGLQKKGFECEILNLDEKIVCIVDFGDLEKEKCHEQVAQLAEQEGTLDPKFRDVIQTISISDVHKNVFSLHNAYSEASRVMEYQLSRGDDQIMSYMEMVKKTQMSYLYSLENETALIHWIYEGKKEAALQLFDEIYEKNVLNVSGSEDLRRCLMWNLTASVLRAENELKDKISLSGMQDMLENIRSRITLYEAKEILAERIGRVCEEVSKAKGKKGEIIADQVREYIQEHYADPNLSNREIAEYFHMNISYLSTFFKDKTGMNPLSYIHKIRLEKAKELLLNTDMTMEEISARVGCNNSVTLNRLFKKYEGTTPVVYKKRNRT